MIILWHDGTWDEFPKDTAMEKLVKLIKETHLGGTIVTTNRLYSAKKEWVEKHYQQADGER